MTTSVICSDVAPWSNRDRKSTRLNSSHPSISYAVFCLKKKLRPPSHEHVRLNRRDSLDHRGASAQLRTMTSTPCCGRSLQSCTVASSLSVFFLNDPSPTKISTLPLPGSLRT